MSKDIKTKWEKSIGKAFLGRRIVKVEYLNKKEVGELDWYSVPCSFQLDNGVWFYPQQDDEGNDGGSLFTTDKELSIVPTLSPDDL